MTILDDDMTHNGQFMTAYGSLALMTNEPKSQKASNGMS